MSHPLVRLARDAVEAYVREGRRIAVPDYVPPVWLTRRAGTFVTLREGDQLRGCIGTILPTEANVAEETIRNAIAAAAQDPRFWPVTPEELPLLSYEVEVLEPPEPVSGPEALDARRYGVLVVAPDGRRGVLLPGVVDTVEEQVQIALRKAGIRPDEPYELYRFGAEVYR